MVRSILDGVAIGVVHQAEVHNPTIAEGDLSLEKEVHVAAGCTLVQMHVTGWAEAQRENPMLSAVLDWLKAQKKMDLKALLVEHTSSKEGQLILWNQHNFTIYQEVLYLCLMPKDETEDLLLFVVPTTHQVTALNAGHQGHNHTLSLLWEHFWWPGKVNQMQQSITSCVHCLQHEGNLPKVPLHPNMAPAPLDLLHIDFTSIEMTMELNQPPRVFQVFQDHFTKHVMAYVTPNQTAKTVAKFLYQGYISIFWTPARLLSNWDANFMSSIID